MKLKKIILFAFLAVTTSGAQQPSSNTVTDRDGTTLTFNTDGITSVTKDGTTRHVPAAWLNQTCSDPSKAGLTDSNDVSDLKILCEDWSQFNVRLRATTFFRSDLSCAEVEG